MTPLKNGGPGGMAFLKLNWVREIIQGRNRQQDELGGQGNDPQRMQ